MDINNFLDNYLNNSRKIVNEIKYLNHGGCGFYAYYLFNYLKENGFKVYLRPLILDATGCKTSDFNNYIKTFDKKYCNYEHIMVHLIFGKTEYLLDSNEIYFGNYKTGDSIENDDENYILGSKIPLKIMEKALSGREYWSAMYDISQNNLLKELVYKL